ncbi:MAG: hypothetical protein HC903_22660 [Methylacidiphilales bacterium]|nr:hypothetical protein [Candidatus Methylacidiphilales bacterium]NJR18503.1 hypothetical protein [Calothrix sp. CSU_2_0]
MKLITTNYLTQISQLPQVGRHIVAQYDEKSSTTGDNLHWKLLSKTFLSSMQKTLDK